MARLLLALMLPLLPALGAALPMISAIFEPGVEYELVEGKRGAAYAAPFIPRENAMQLERAASEAWNYFDAQLYFRIMASIYGRGCSGGPQRDSLLDIWEGANPEAKERTIPKSVDPRDYCDGTLPRTPVRYEEQACPSYKLDWDDMNRRLAEAKSHAFSVYYPRYLDRIEAAIARYAPRGLYWQDYRRPGQGAFLTPVAGRRSPNWQKLVSRIREVLGVKAPIYTQQAAPGTSPAERTKELGVPLNPRGSFDPPGIMPAELKKYTLSERRGVHDVPRYWSGAAGGPVPQGDPFTAPSAEYEVYGVAPHLYLYSAPFSETSPRVPVYWITCYVYVEGARVSQPLPIYLPTNLSGHRVDTRWQALVEGYQVLDVRGAPHQKK